MASVLFDIGCLDYPIGDVSHRRAISTKREQGFVQGREIYSREQRRVRLPLRHATHAEIYNLRRLWHETLGGTLPMSWAPIDGTAAFEVKFHHRSGLVLQQANRQYFTVGVELLERL